MATQNVNKYAETMSIIRRIRQQTDTAVLYYSAGGKDGIALLDMLAPVFKKVICYYMWLVPGLDHVKPYLQWAVRKYPNVEVRQIQHYQLLRPLRILSGWRGRPKHQAPKGRRA